MVFVTSVVLVDAPFLFFALKHHVGSISDSSTTQAAEQVRVALDGKGVVANGSEGVEVDVCER